MFIPRHSTGHELRAVHHRGAFFDAGKETVPLVEFNYPFKETAYLVSMVNKNSVAGNKLKSCTPRIVTLPLFPLDRPQPYGFLKRKIIIKRALFNSTVLNGRWQPAIH